MSNAIPLEGIVKEVRPMEQKSPTFSMRSLIMTLEPESKYPQVVEIQFTKEGIEQLNAVQPGMKLKVFVNIRGREWTNPQGEVKYFTSLSGWKFEVLGGQQQPPQQQQQFQQPIPQQPQQQFQQPVQQYQHPVQQQQFQAPPQQPSNPNDDLPF